MKYILMLFFITFSLLSSANERLKHVILKNNDGDEISINIDSYVNANNTFEVKIDSDKLPKFLNKLNPTILYGRDLNHNGKIDTWFILEKSGVKTIQIEGKDKLGLDILPEVIFPHFKSSVSLYLNNATITVLSYLFISMDELKNQNINFYYDWINLEELNLLIEQDQKLEAPKLTRMQQASQYQILSAGLNELSSNLDRFIKKDIYGYIAADVGLWITGGVVLKWSGKLVKAPLKWISETKFYSYVEENLATFVNAQKDAISHKLTLLKNKFQKIDHKTTSLVIKESMKISWRESLNYSLRAIPLKNNILKIATGVFQGARAEWKYVALNLTMQTTAEAISHYDQIKDPNPIKMAENLFSDPEVIQNIEFMTADTILMTGLSKSLKTDRAKFMACGLVALNDSSIINFVVKKEDNYERIALDTSWEMLIGNTQVQADLKALNYFEKMAIKNKNPKLKLIGYAFVVIDQTIGYFTYSKASNKVESLQPIFAE